ncbi:hypothetical protein [Lysobacter sp. Root96]|uniref:hypothetical protein n=1 Tax=Lysobacter sp. Root96 TaxID=1736612 RepID=UPI0006FC1476|nr:hypothetical protein [Lysobacter sp. Root96]KRD71394.1 hypothetical protein ASE45_06180 [Lysobacter sp. Root96]
MKARDWFKHNYPSAELLILGVLSRPRYEVMLHGKVIGQAIRVDWAWADAKRTMQAAPKDPTMAKPSDQQIREAFEKCSSEAFEQADPEGSWQWRPTPLEAFKLGYLAAIDAATPEGAQAQRYGWVMTGPCGSTFIPASHGHIVQATAQDETVTYVEVYTNAARDAEDAITEAYKTWPEDIRKKLSLHDLRRMGGWAPRPNPSDWRIDTSAGGPILVYQDCSVIEGEQARYLLGLIAIDAARSDGGGG